MPAKSKSDRRVNRAANDHLTLLVPLQDVQSRHHLGHEKAKQAVREAERRAEQRNSLARLRKQKEIDRIIKILRRAETTYPNVLRSVMRSRQHSKIAKRYRSRARTGHKLTRPRISQISRALRVLCRLANRPIGQIVREAELGLLRTSVEIERGR